MAENTDIDTTHDDDLVDEALDRTDGGKFCGFNSGICAWATKALVGPCRVGRS